MLLAASLADHWGPLGIAGDRWGPLGTAGDRWGPAGTGGDRRGPVRTLGMKTSTRPYRLASNFQSLCMVGYAPNVGVILLLGPSKSLKAEHQGRFTAIEVGVKLT